MKILFLAAANSIHTVRWVNSLSLKGHEVHLVYNACHSPSIHSINSGVICHPLKNGTSAGYYLNAGELKSLFKEIRPDVVSAHYASGYGTLARISALKPLVLSVWGSDIYDFPKGKLINRSILRKNLSYAKVITSSSRCMAEECLQVGENLNLDIRVVPFGVDVKKFNPMLFKRENKDEILIGFAKSLKKLYAADDFIKSVKYLMDKLKDSGNGKIADKIRVEIYGDGEEREALMELNRNLFTDKIISFMGAVPNDELPRKINNFDIFCATSLRESFGVSLIEAMAMEKAVVATSAPGFMEVVDDGVTGIIVKTGDTESISEGLKKLVLDKALREKMGSRAREKVLKEYNWDENVSLMEEVYKEAVENGKRE